MKRMLVLFIFSGLFIVTNGQSVYKTPSGKKYHLFTCHMVKNVSEKITIEEAIAEGLTPCKICRPPAQQTKVQASTKTPAGQSNTVQCKGTTKAGTRCKHMTRIGNGYCFQHQPN